MKRILYIICFICFAELSFGQLNQRGIPIVTNYSPSTYDASTQNWAVVQDNRGVMYFGNNDDGVLEYDGRTWRKIPVLNKAIVRSLAVDSLGTVYVGTQNDFGVLLPNVNGELQYNSLKHLITDSIETYSDIWKTYSFKGNIYFYTKNIIFRYDGSSIKAIDIGPNNVYYNNQSFVCNNRFYIGSYRGGLRELTESSITTAPNGEYFKEQNIWSMFAETDSTALIVSDKALYSYNQISGKVSTAEHSRKYYDKALKDEALPYFGIRLNDSNIAIAYVFNEDYSFAKLTPTGIPIEIVTKSLGLQDEFVTNLYQSQTDGGSSPVWLSLNSGISRIDIHSPLRKFGELNGIKGGMLDVVKFNGKIFAATFSGVYHLTFDNDGVPHFNSIPQINLPAWNFLIFKDPKTKKEHLLVGASGAIYDIDKNLNVINISDSPGFKDSIQHVCYHLLQSEVNPEIVNIAVRGGLAQMAWRNGKWENLGFLTAKAGGDFVGEGRRVAEDEEGNLWLTTQIHGLKKISVNGSSVKITDFDMQHGLPDLKDNYVYKVNNKILVATPKGLKQFNPITNYFEPASLFGIEGAEINYALSKIIPFHDGFIISCHDNNLKKIEFHKLGSDGKPAITDTPFKPISGKFPDAIYADDAGLLWMAMSNDLYSFDPSVSRNYTEEFNVLIRKVTTKKDSVLFLGTFYAETPDGKLIASLKQNPKQVPSLPFSLNSLVFDVAAPFFENEEFVEYSFIMEGNDKEWSKWDIDPKPIYNYISEGTYAFKVKARNIFGVESNVAEYRFTISPPWYRSILALIAYVLLLAGFIWAIVVLNTRRLIAEKERLEQIVKERTAEVVAQKEELEKQRDKIFEQNEEIKSSINYASRIQNALLTPIETLNAMFDDYFILYLPRDIVSGDFYWQTRIGNRKICVVADCTGHGVPGGFMSMLGMGFLTQITTKSEKLSASQILDQLRAQIIISLHQTGKTGENKDGMDLALYIIDEDTGMLEFAGANNPLILIRDNEVIQIKGDKMPIGIHIKCDTPFTNNVMEYKKGDVLYTFSDGYVDQFGGPDLRKFMIKNLKDILLEIHKKPMEEQREFLHKTIVEWQGDTPRIDDIVLMGVRL